MVAIEAIGCAPILQRLRITFRHGRIYDYYRVPVEVYEQFMCPTSLGGFFDRYIDGRYPC